MGDTTRELKWGTEIMGGRLSKRLKWNWFQFGFYAIPGNAQGSLLEGLDTWSWTWVGCMHGKSPTCYYLFCPILVGLGTLSVCCLTKVHFQGYFFAFSKKGSRDQICLRYEVSEKQGPSIPKRPNLPVYCFAWLFSSSLGKSILYNLCSFHFWKYTDVPKVPLFSQYSFWYDTNILLFPTFSL